MTLLQQFDRNIVGRAEKRHVPIARRYVYSDTGIEHLLAKRINIIHLVGKMSELTPALVNLSIPVISQLEQRSAYGSLSVQITVTEPKLSTAGNFLTIAFCFAILMTPSERARVITITKPSGIAATAKLTAISNMK